MTRSMLSMKACAFHVNAKRAIKILYQCNCVHGSIFGWQNKDSCNGNYRLQPFSLKVIYLSMPQCYSKSNNDRPKILSCSIILYRVPCGTMKSQYQCKASVKMVFRWCFKNIHISPSKKHILQWNFAHICENKKRARWWKIMQMYCVRKKLWLF